MIPLTRRLFWRLPDRGFGMARAVGLLAAGYCLWLGATIGLVQNSVAGILSIVVFLVVFNLWLQQGRWQELVEWLREHIRPILTTEVVFLAAFVGWAVVRAASPEILGTEKPMELAFLNSIVNSDAFPPLDPWLSGHAISYYYFGYVMAGMLTIVSGVAAPVAFNLTSALWFALVAASAYSLVYNLISIRTGERSPVAGLLGPLFILVLGNLEGFLEILHAQRLFWSADGTSALWSWIDLKELDLSPPAEAAWIPSRHWWWWRASRVVRDVNLLGNDIEVIDEFPAFSFVLADIHPHVLALPFVLMAVAFALNLYLGGAWQGGKPKEWPSPRWRRYAIWGVGLSFAGTTLGSIIARAIDLGGMPGLALISSALLSGVLVTVGLILAALLVFVLAGWLETSLDRTTLLAAGWIFGGLAFLNAWDLPIYLSLLLFVLLYLGRKRGWEANLRVSLTSAAAIAVLAVAFYGFWYPTFSSQASGVLPNLGFPTKIQHTFIMFAPLVIPPFVWLLRGWRPRRQELVRVAGLAVGFALCLWLASWVLAALVALAGGQVAINAFVDQLGAASIQAAVRSTLVRRVAQPWTPLILGVTLAIVWSKLNSESRAEATTPETRPDLGPFILILIGVGALLVTGPEFFYLKDLFGTRMNTVFKFYYAAWILWGIASAFVIHELFSEEAEVRTPWRWLALLMVALGLGYPFMATATRASGLMTGSTLSLDGSDHLDAAQPSEAAALDWINANLEGGVVAEAIGGSYSQYARVATYTPLTTVLGWDWHEIQWRGTAEPQGSRKSDVERLYRTPDWREAKDIVDRYGIEYVFIGPLERSTYGGISENKFGAFMSLIYENEAVHIYSLGQDGALP